ncbi:MAG: RNA polymerase sigma factor RpoD/SigA [Candidatus Methylomirabilales bacterium]|nr:RNA polymerase sigma factor RpoD/SigA [candidate division NC10 bacterium]
MARRTPQFYEEITDEALSTYLRRIVKIPLLSKAEELHLATQIHKRDENAVRKLVESNLRFVVKVALQYQGYGLSLLDLINEGNLGLLEASCRYSPDYNVKFITYAVWWIRQAIMQALARASGALRFPLRKIRLASKLRSRRAEMLQQEGKEPTEEELARDLKLTRAEVDALLQTNIPPTSLEEIQRREEAREPGMERVPPADNELVRKSFEQEVERLLKVLTPRERAIIELRYGLGKEEPMTLEEVGKRFRLSRERIRQVEEKAKKKLLAMARARHLQDFLN